MFDGSALPLKENLDIAGEAPRTASGGAISSSRSRPGVVGGEEDGITAKRRGEALHDT
jgi:fructose/tagatose bisphosphate aldolase